MSGWAHFFMRVFYDSGETMADEPTDENYEELVKQCKPLSDQIRAFQDSETVIFEFYTSREEQKDMVEFGFVGDFTDTAAPCERVQKPYITIKRYFESGLQDRDNVQCPLYREKCEKIQKETDSGAQPCELLSQKIKKLLD